MDKIQIQILDSSWSGVIDVNNDGKFPFALTSSIADISKISDRSGSWSFPFEVVSTKENDKFLEHLYYSSQKNYKNFDDKKEAKVIINGIDIDTGTVRIERIASKRNDRKYKWTFYGNNLDWVLLMNSNTFQDLPYLDNTFTYSSSEVANSWTNVAGDYNPLYAYIKRGNRKSATELSTVDFYPDYYLYDIVKEAFKSVGYNVESDWLELADTKKIIESFFGQNFKRTEADIAANSAQVDFQGGITTLVDSDFVLGNNYTLDLDNTYTNSPLVGTQQTWNLLTGNSAGVFNVTNGEYTAPYNGYYDFTIVGEFTIAFDSSATNPLNAINYRLDFGSGSYLFSQSAPIIDTTTVGGTTTVTYELTANIDSLYLDSGDVVQPIVIFYGSTNATSATSFTYQHTSLNYKADLLEILLDGEVYNWKEVSDSKKSLLKYITDVAKVHNLYFRTNTSTKTVYIEPRDDFYKPITTAVDWTDRVYQNQQYELKYNSSFYKRNQFYGYAKDSNDKYLEEKTKELKEELMGVTHVFPDKFAEGTTSLRAEMLSPTFVYQDEFGVVCSHMIDDETGDAKPTTDFNPRLLYYEYGSQLGFDLSTDTSFTLDGTTYDTIPYALPFDYIQEGITRADVNGNLSFKDLNGVNGRYTDYHSTTADEIVNGMTLSISLIFDFVDYRDLDFRTPVYFDNRYPDIEGYWHIQKVKGFKNDTATKFELIQAKNYIKDSINPFNDEGDTVPYEADDFSSNRLSSDLSNGKRESIGFHNVVEGSNVVVGNHLTAEGLQTVRTGVHNLDVSSDIFQLGAGTEYDPFSLIRVTEDGNVFFNDILVKGDNIKTVTSSTPATVDVLTYLCDTSSNDISILLPAAITKGKVWNIKKTSQNNTLRIFSARTIDDKSEIFVKSIYTSVAIQDDGANYIII